MSETTYTEAMIAARAAEREAIAKMLEEMADENVSYGNYISSSVLDEAAVRVRARGSK